MTTAMTLLAPFGGTVGVWTVSVVLTLLLIGPPLLWAFALTFATDDEAFDRAVTDAARVVQLKGRAAAHAYGRDPYGVPATPQAQAEPAADVVAFPASRSSS